MLLSVNSTIGLPHVRGGVSYPGDAPPVAAGVFPTCVGVFPRWRRSGRLLIRLPHVRGGVSADVKAQETIRRSSPRAWGCFHEPVALRGPLRVFPTCVGVFPLLTTYKEVESGLPHVRGGVSAMLYWTEPKRGSSPRAWGCFCYHFCHPCWEIVFPTCVGVFPTSAPHADGSLRLPHVRGGVSMPLPTHQTL